MFVCCRTPTSSVLHVFFFNDTATTEIYTLSLHDALPICVYMASNSSYLETAPDTMYQASLIQLAGGTNAAAQLEGDRKSTRLNSSHANISYAVFCLKKKKIGRAHV